MLSRIFISFAVILAFCNFILGAHAEKDLSVPTSHTSLINAVIAGDTKKTKQLIESGHSVNAADDKYGATALHWAAAQGNGAIVKMLLNAKANVDAKDAEGNASLYLAAINGHKDIMDMLCKAKAGSKERNKYNINSVGQQQQNSELIAALVSVVIVFLIYINGPYIIHIR